MTGRVPGAAAAAAGGGCGGGALPAAPAPNIRM